MYDLNPKQTSITVDFWHVCYGIFRKTNQTFLANSVKTTTYGLTEFDRQTANNALESNSLRNELTNCRNLLYFFYVVRY